MGIIRGVDKMAKKDKQLEALLDQITDVARKATEQIAEEVATRIEIAYERCIEEFYNDYPNPMYYDRTFSTYYASPAFGDFRYGDEAHGFGVMWKKKNNQIIKKNKKGYLAGIVVDPKNIPGNPYDGRKPKAFTSWVFTRTFEQGIHGLTPEEVLHGTLLSDKKPDPFYRHRPKRTGGRSYWRVEPMNPPPYKLMNDNFNEITKQLGSITNEIIYDAIKKQLK